MTVTIFLQDGAGFTATRTGYVFVPFAIGFFVASTLSARIMNYIGRYILNLGGSMMVLGLIGIDWLTRSHGTALTLRHLIPMTLCYGFGQGCVMPQLVNIVLSSVDPTHAGSASGLLTTTQQVALAAGVAAIGNVYFSLLGAHPGSPDFARALGSSLLWNIGLLILAVVLAFLLPRRAKHEVSQADSHAAAL
jgi:predicted MFS family arabinose efflux permease